MFFNKCLYWFESVCFLTTFMVMHVQNVAGNWTKDASVPTEVRSHSCYIYRAVKRVDSDSSSLSTRLAERLAIKMQCRLASTEKSVDVISCYRIYMTSMSMSKSNDINYRYQDDSRDIICPANENIFLHKYSALNANIFNPQWTDKWFMTIFTDSYYNITHINAL